MSGLAIICKRPVHIGLLVVCHEVIQIVSQRWYFANTAVWSFGVVPQQVFHKAAIENFRIIQLIGVPVGELLLDGAVETLQIAIGLGVFGVVEEMHQSLILAGLGEVLLEFTAVIGLDSSDGKRRYSGELIQEITAVGGGIGAVSIGKSKTGAHINGSEQIAFEASDKEMDGVHLYQVPGLVRIEALPA